MRPPFQIWALQYNPKLSTNKFWVMVLGFKVDSTILGIVGVWFSLLLLGWFHLLFLGWLHRRFVQTACFFFLLKRRRSTCANKKYLHNLWRRRCPRRLPSYLDVKGCPNGWWIRRAYTKHQPTQGYLTAPKLEDAALHYMLLDFFFRRSVGGWLTVFYEKITKEWVGFLLGFGEIVGANNGVFEWINGDSSH